MELNMQNVQKGHTSPRDFFLHLGIIVALYASAVSLITLLFNIVDLAFPDALQMYSDPYSTGIRFAIASLIIFFPTYILLGWLYSKDVVTDASKKNLGIRRWLVYLTLFITGLAIVIDLVMLLNNFLGGEISSRFILKILAVLVVAGLVFAYYILNLRGGHTKNTFRTFVVIGTVLVLASLVYGFYLMGSPMTQRQMRFDAQRINDLQTIQWQVVSSWHQKQKLPQKLTDTEDPLSGYVLPKDPETGLAYDYRVVSPLSFEVCATFDLALASSSGKSTISTYPAYPSDTSMVNWQHDVGKQCFTRTIDPQKYPPMTTGTKPIF